MLSRPFSGAHRTRMLAAVGAAAAVATTAIVAANVHAESNDGLGSCHDTGDGYGVCVTMPVDDKPDETINSEMARHIEATEKGDTIRMAMYEWQLADDESDGPERIAEALVDAHDRGVDAEVVLGDTTDLRDGKDVNKKLRQLLNDSGVPYKVCMDACVDVDPDNRKGAMHNKFVLIERGDDNTILQSSANLLEVQARSPQNMLINRNDDALFEYLSENWEKLKAEKRWDHSDIERLGDKDSKAYIFRRDKGDPFLAILKHVTECTPEHNKVWLTASGGSLGGEKVLARLSEMQDELGCDVRVNVSVGDNNEQAVEDAGIDKDKAMSLSRNHNKLLYIDATYNDKTGPVAFTGSYNALDTGTSLRFNDEVMIRCADTDVTTWYEDYFELMFDNASNRT